MPLKKILESSVILNYNEERVFQKQSFWKEKENEFPLYGDIIGNPIPCNILIRNKDFSISRVYFQSWKEAINCSNAYLYIYLSD